MTIENVLICDVETTGLDEKKCQIIELGAILYNIKTKSILQCFSTLFPCESNPVEHINHISVESTKCNMYTTNAFLGIFAAFQEKSQAFIAHNAQFDEKFIHTIFGDIKNPFICTKSQFKWPSHPSRLRLQDVCHSMGVPYGEESHRALYDAERIALCFSKVDDLQERIDAAYERAIK